MIGRIIETGGGGIEAGGAGGANAAGDVGASTSTSTTSNVGTRGGANANAGVWIFAVAGTGTGDRDEIGATLLAGAGGGVVRCASAGGFGNPARVPVGRDGGGVVVLRIGGAGGGVDDLVDLIGATATPTMSPSSRSSVARRSRIAGGGAVFISAGPEAGAGGGDETGPGVVDVRDAGRGIAGRTLALMDHETSKGRSAANGILTWRIFAAIAGDRVRCAVGL